MNIWCSLLAKYNTECNTDYTRWNSLTGQEQRHCSDQRISVLLFSYWCEKAHQYVLFPMEGRLAGLRRGLNSVSWWSWEEDRSFSSWLPTTWAKTFPSLGLTHSWACCCSCCLSFSGRERAPKGAHPTYAVTRRLVLMASAISVSLFHIGCCTVYLTMFTGACSEL